VQQEIQNAIRKLEDASEEVDILFKMSETTWEHYSDYKNGQDSKPKQLGEWNESSLKGEFQNIIEAIGALEEVKEKLQKFL